MTEKNYVLNVKTAAGTIFTVRGDTAKELQDNILDVFTTAVNQQVSELEALLTGRVQSAVETVQNTLGATVVRETVTAPTFAPVPPPNTPAGVGSRTCIHGTMVGRKGNGAKGEWKGFFCPTPKGTADQCQPQWLTKKDVEWATI
jgi:hypothetical protein